MQSIARKHFWVAWLLLSALAAGVCSLTWPAAHLGAERLPAGNDSFYHARRILDTAAHPTAFYQFDPHIHAPEGSLIVWPWGYDYVMGLLTRLGMALNLANDPISILVWIPLLAVPVSIALIMRIAQRMGLPLWGCALAAACVALSPLTQYLHGVGFIDHHFAEYLLVLASICVGLAWLEEPDSMRSAIGLGAVLGVAPAIHNGLFILQIPLVATFLIHWLLERRMPQRSVAAFGVSLLTSTLLVLLPSLPFRAGVSEFYLLSWFHLYVALGTALCCAYFARYPFDRKHAAIFAAGGTLLLLPLLRQAVLAHSFLTGEVLRLDVIAEMQSPLHAARLEGAMYIINRYSLLICLVPLNGLICVYMAWLERSSHRLLYWIATLGGLSLLLLQQRLHYFGSLALCIPLLVAAQHLTSAQPSWRLYLPRWAAAIVLVMLVPPLRGQLLGPMVPANDPYFINVRESYKVLAKACKEDPGVVLADNDAGHPIRYYTDCDVIVDNFLLTAQHEAKVRQMEQLFATPAVDLPQRAPFVKYLFVRPAAIAETQQGLMYKSYSDGVDHLVNDLLLRPYTNLDAIPSGFQLLYRTDLVDANIKIPYLAVYKIHRPSSSQERTSAE